MTDRVYRRTQRGTLIVVLVGAALLLLVYLMATVGAPPVAIVVAGLLVVVLVAFSSLTVEVSDAEIAAWFGPLPLKRRVRLSEIRSARVVHTPWYYGWGIRWMPGGWIFSVSGTAGVELQLRWGGRFRIGSDAPEEVARALESRGVPILPR